jgi:hypothetical protein
LDVLFEYLEGIAQNGKATYVSMLVSESRLKISPSCVHFESLRTARSNRCALRPTHSCPTGRFETHNTRNRIRAAEGLKIMKVGGLLFVVQKVATTAYRSLL